MITDEQAYNLAESIIDINCSDCKSFSEPLGESECWCDSIGEIVSSELFLMGFEGEDKRVNDEDKVARAWELIQRERIHGVEK
jgi:hypothetical protein